MCKSELYLHFSSNYFQLLSNFLLPHEVFNPPKKSLCHALKTAHVSIPLHTSPFLDYKLHVCLCGFFFFWDLMYTRAFTGSFKNDQHTIRQCALTLTLCVKKKVPRNSNCFCACYSEEEIVLKYFILVTDEGKLMGKLHQGFIVVWRGGGEEVTGPTFAAYRLIVMFQILSSPQRSSSTFWSVRRPSSRRNNKYTAESDPTEEHCDAYLSATAELQR